MVPVILIVAALLLYVEYEKRTGTHPTQTVPAALNAIKQQNAKPAIQAAQAPTGSTIIGGSAVTPVSTPTAPAPTVIFKCAPIPATACTFEVAVSQHCYCEAATVATAAQQSAVSWSPGTQPTGPKRVSITGKLPGYEEANSYGVGCSVYLWVSTDGTHAWWGDASSNPITSFTPSQQDLSDLAAMGVVLQ